MSNRADKNSLQGILRFALENTKQVDEPPSFPLVESLNGERQQFLENVFKSMTSDAAELQKASAILETKSATTEDKLNALNVIRDLVANIDCANNFIKLRGSKIILDYLKNQNLAVKTCVIYIIAEMSQNNPVCQEHFVKAGLIAILIANLQCEEELLSCSLHAISALIRNYEPGCIEFRKLNGIQYLLNCLKTDDPKVFVKSCYLVRALTMEHATIKVEFVELSTIEILANYLETVSEFNAKTESILFALCALTDTDEGRERLKNTRIKEQIQTLATRNSDKPECEDMNEYAKILLGRMVDKNTAAV